MPPTSLPLGPTCLAPWQRTPRVLPAPCCYHPHHLGLLPWWPSALSCLDRFGRQRNVWKHLSPPGPWRNGLWPWGVPGAAPGTPVTRRAIVGSPACAWFPWNQAGFRVHFVSLRQQLGVQEKLGPCPTPGDGAGTMLVCAISALHCLVRDFSWTWGAHPCPHAIGDRAGCGLGSPDTVP